MAYEFTRSLVHPTLGTIATVLIWGFDELAGYDLRSGEVLWRCPIAADGDLVASVVSEQEHIYCAGPRETVAVHMPPSADSQPSMAWRVKVAGSNCSSPVLSRGMLFMVSDGGKAACLDARCGRVLWSRRLPGEYYASPIAMGDLVYFCNSAGFMTAVAAEGSYREVANLDLGEPVYASFAPFGNRVIAWTVGRLVCVGDSGAPPQTPDPVAGGR